MSHHIVWKWNKDNTPSEEVLQYLKEDAKRISITRGSSIPPRCPNLEWLDVRGMTPEYMEYILAHPTITTLYIFLHLPTSLDLRPLVHIRHLFVDMSNVDGYSQPLPPVSLFFPPNLTHLHIASLLLPHVYDLPPSVHFLEALPIEPDYDPRRNNARLRFLKNLCVDVISKFSNVKSFFLISSLNLHSNRKIISALQTHRSHTPFAHFEVGLQIFDHEEMRVLAQCTQSLKVDIIYLLDDPVLSLATFQAITSSPLKKVTSRNYGMLTREPRIPFCVELEWFSYLKEAHVMMVDGQFRSDGAVVPHSKIKKVVLDFSQNWEWDRFSTVELVAQKFRPSLTCIVVKFRGDKVRALPIEGFEYFVYSNYNVHTAVYTAVCLWSPKLFPTIATSEQVVLRTLMLGITRALHVAALEQPKIKIGLADALEWSLESLIVKKHNNVNLPCRKRVNYLVNGISHTVYDGSFFDNVFDEMSWLFFDFSSERRLRNFTDFV